MGGGGVRIVQAMLGRAPRHATLYQSRPGGAGAAGYRGRPRSRGAGARGALPPEQHRRPARARALLRRASGPRPRAGGARPRAGGAAALAVAIVGDTASFPLLRPKTARDGGGGGSIASHGPASDRRMARPALSLSVPGRRARARRLGLYGRRRYGLTISDMVESALAKGGLLSRRSLIMR